MLIREWWWRGVARVALAGSLSLLTSCQEDEEAELLETKVAQAAVISKLEGELAAINDELAALSSVDPAPKIAALAEETTALERRNEDLVAAVAELEKEAAALDLKLKDYRVKYPVRD